MRRLEKATFHSWNAQGNGEGTEFCSGCAGAGKVHMGELSTACREERGNAKVPLLRGRPSLAEIHKMLGS